MINIIKDVWVRRPFWMNGVFLFCAYMTVVYLPWDVFVKPIAEDQEVWFGVTFYGWLAKLGGVIHWLVYAILTHGLWHMRPWARLYIIGYLLQVAWSMFFWATLRDDQNVVWINMGLAMGFVFLSILFYRKKSYFQSTLS